MFRTTPLIGRFAPSPTGALHTGSLVSAVGSWLMAKSAGGQWLVRIDDLDSQRQVPGMADDILATLERFALFWDGEISRQSLNLELYEQAFQELKRKALLYPCCCSRREISQAASAPHPTDDCLPYPGSCRNGMPEGRTVRSWRVRVTDEPVCFHDLRRGMICQNLLTGCGDFPLRRADGEFAYQLAVVLDDRISGVNQVVRGDDLLASTPRQIHLQRLLALPQPEYCHLPLVTGPGGTKLSKRDNLVSHHLGNWKDREGVLLHRVLRFLGQEPPAELSGASCPQILAWGAAHFDLRKLPRKGGELTLVS
ncbi:tRNA glutamyl-Q(34) synthetase GluQRS [Pelobacter propionicus]|uniref:Glutamyl-Q tRNA(Asp) synthetase n=1 Tax=Pelobacter propionicus (strain DSM 2379 / NBRC 103807 / OttBd1) TaxID=338966 RepID=A1AUE3_PELPD|nr:tRNA glutamyl-Q(34) synthetase GluQRS [Pelobacter propionicus]ABL00964.1 Glutamate--tRNA ligase [Pelobacter propionicus DSM 2379]